MSEPRARNWGGNVTFAAARLHRPRTLDELRRIVAASRRIRALGSGHSFSAVADTTGDLVRLDRLPHTVDVDPDSSTVTVAAGATYAEVATRLQAAGYALANLASLPHISVAGSVATGTHGSGEALPCLAAQVRAVRLVGPEGDLVDLDRDADPDTFPGAVVALGALGVVTRLTLDVEPTYRLAQHVRVGVPLDEVAERLDEVFGAAYSVSVFTHWIDGEAVVWLKRRTDRPVADWAGGRAATVPVHPVPELPADNCTDQLDVPGPWHERLPHFRPDYVPGSGRELQSEYYLPRHRATEAIAALRRLAPVLDPVLQISELRAVRGDDLWLSPAYRRDSVTVHFTWADDPVAVPPVIRAVEELLLPLGARPHWGKLSAADPARIAAGYERAEDFRKLAASLDPVGRFRNAHLDALFPA
ncbi:FAD-binding protein [Micromonospora rosaria]|uniref:FAD-binding protein n=1 Tax=Micromonospora rosaria TaxID=47874 RepID=A0A136PXF5_9ACTN|nr:FAD-binding protein [Micromonospora rosaria]KXK63102.1 FAD-binding protein [Micromonospora rosaria]